jgi:hypothetical protein
MTGEEQAFLRQIAETTKRILEQQDLIARLTAENQPTDAAVDLLCSLLDSVRVQQNRLELLRATDRPEALRVKPCPMLTALIAEAVGQQGPTTIPDAWARRPAMALWLLGITPEYSVKQPRNFFQRVGLGHKGNPSCEVRPYS